MTAIHLTLTIPEGATTCEGCEYLNERDNIAGGYWCGIFEPYLNEYRRIDERPQECLDAERKAKGA